MLTINDITVRLGGRVILDKAGAALPPRSRIGLIGRNGAGKSTLMKAIIGQIEPDGGSVEMPRGTRLGYIAQEAPSGSATPVRDRARRRHRTRRIAGRERDLRGSGPPWRCA
jgi:ATP-binding cassette subfamily F protein 3